MQGFRFLHSQFLFLLFFVDSFETAATRSFHRYCLVDATLVSINRHFLGDIELYITDIIGVSNFVHGFTSNAGGESISLRYGTILLTTKTLMWVWVLNHHTYETGSLRRAGLSGYFFFE